MRVADLSQTNNELPKPKILDPLYDYDIESLDLKFHHHKKMSAPG